MRRIKESKNPKDKMGHEAARAIFEESFLRWHGSATQLGELVDGTPAPWIWLSGITRMLED